MSIKLNLYLYIALYKPLNNRGASAQWSRWNGCRKKHDGHNQFYNNEFQATVVVMTVVTLTMM